MTSQKWIEELAALPGWEARLAAIRAKAARRCGLREYPADAIRYSELANYGWPGREIRPGRGP